MGSQTIMDIIGSIVVFGWLFLMTLQGNVANSENIQTLKGDLLVQENLVEITRLLEYDFRKIGFCNEPNNLPDPTKAILSADTSSIKVSYGYRSRTESSTASTIISVQRANSR